jgi:hypothetical protein
MWFQLAAHDPYYTAGKEYIDVNRVEDPMMGNWGHCVLASNREPSYMHAAIDCIGMVVWLEPEAKVSE